MATTGKKTPIDRAIDLLGVVGGGQAIIAKISELWGAMPKPIQEKVSQKLPGFMGLDTKDEEIINALLPKLNIETEQKVIVDFLDTQCKDFQIKHLVLKVASMEVTKGTPQVVERKWNEKIKQFEDKVTSAKDGEDLRLDFLKNLAAYINKHGEVETYKRCIKFRLFNETSTFEDFKHAFGAGGKEIDEKASKLIHGTSTLQDIFGKGDREAAKQALKEAWGKIKGR